MPSLTEARDGRSVKAEAAVAAGAEGIQDAAVSEAEEPLKKKQRTTPKKPTVFRLLLKKHATESEKLETNQFLLETSARIDGAISELMKCCSVLSDSSEENELMRREAIKNIRESILPVMHIASRSLGDTGMSFAPFGGTRELHHRNEVARKHNVVDRTSEKSPELQLIDDFVKRSIVESPQHIAKVSTAKLSTSTQGTLRLDMDEDEDAETITIIRPISGNTYTKSEALRCAKLYQKQSKGRMLAIKAMIQKGWAPCTVRTIQKLCQMDEEGHSIVEEDWAKTGRPKTLHPQEIRARAKKRAAALGKPKKSEMVVVTLKKEKRKSSKRKSAEVAERPAEPREVAETSTKKPTEAQEHGPAERAQKSDPKEENGGVEPIKHPALEESTGVNMLIAALEPQTDLSKSASKPQSAPKKSPVKQSTSELQMQKPGHIKVVSKPRTKTCEHERQENENVRNFPLPEPEDGGRLYKKSEAIRIAKQYKKGSRERRWAMEAMIYRGYVPVVVRSIQMLLQQDERGVTVEDTPWGSGKGRKALLTNEEVDAIVARIKDEDGRMYGKEDVERWIVEAVRERLIKEGKDSEEIDVTVNKTTVRNYATLFRSKLPSAYWKE